jgi:predicted kinase
VRATSEAHHTAAKTVRLLLITGLPGSGKSTLARLLARRYAVLLLSKDAIKEPLLEVIGTGDAAHSRMLSDASFAVLFAVARQALTARLDVILDANFRPGEHEAALAEFPSASIAQVLCQIDEPVRLARVARRRQDGARHPGHGDATPAVQAQRASDAFLELPGERLTLGGGESADARALEAIDRYWHGA